MTGARGGACEQRTLESSKGRHDQQHHDDERNVRPQRRTDLSRGELQLLRRPSPRRLPGRSLREDRGSGALLRHEREVQVETRAVNATYADPPLWLVEKFATYPRPDRVLANAIAATGGLIKIAQRPGFNSVNVPRLTTGTSTAIETPGSPVSDTDVTDAQAVTAKPAPPRRRRARDVRRPRELHKHGRSARPDDRVSRRRHRRSGEFRFS